MRTLRQTTGREPLVAPDAIDGRQSPRPSRRSPGGRRAAGRGRRARPLRMGDRCDLADRLEGHRPVGGPPHGQELQAVLGVHLVEEADGPDMGRAAGGGAGLLAALPETERQARPVIGGRSLEVVDEARGRRGLLVGELVIRGQPLLVRVGTADGAERDQVPAAFAELGGTIGPVEGLVDGHGRVCPRDRPKARQRVHRLAASGAARRLSNHEIGLFRRAGVLGRWSCTDGPDDRARGAGQEPGDARTPREAAA